MRTAGFMRRLGLIAAAVMLVHVPSRPAGATFDPLREMLARADFSGSTAFIHDVSLPPDAEVQLETVVSLGQSPLIVLDRLYVNGSKTGWGSSNLLSCSGHESYVQGPEPVGVVIDERSDFRCNGFSRNIVRVWSDEEVSLRFVTIVASGRPGMFGWAELTGQDGARLDGRSTSSRVGFDLDRDFFGTINVKAGVPEGGQLIVGGEVRRPISDRLYGEFFQRADGGAAWLGYRSDSGSDSSLGAMTFNALPPGDYRFRVELQAAVDLFGPEVWLITADIPDPVPV